MDYRHPDLRVMNPLAWQKTGSVATQANESTKKRSPNNSGEALEG
jgi:hypothetical protein